MASRADGSSPRSFFHGKRCATSRIGIWLAWKPSASASASKSACSGTGQMPPPEPAPRFLTQRGKVPPRAGFPQPDPRANEPSTGEQRPGTAPGRGRRSSEAQSGCSSAHGATSCALEHHLRHAAKSGGRGEESLRALRFPDDVQNRFVVGGSVSWPCACQSAGRRWTSTLPIVSSGSGLPSVGKPHHGAGEIGTAAMIPKSGLDDFDRAAVVGGQAGVDKAARTKAPGPPSRWAARRLFAQRDAAAGNREARSGFHSRNLIPSPLKS